jgi:hypothetical protein
MKRLAFASIVALSLAGTAHSQQVESQQLKAVPVKSYVLTEPDGTPRYVVQYSEQSNFRKVYHVKPDERASTSAPQRAEGNRRPARKKRFIWPTEIM